MIFFTDILLYSCVLATFLLIVRILTRYVLIFPAVSVYASKLSAWLWASKCSFFSIAAWYCLIAPFVAAAFSRTIMLRYDGYERWLPESFPTKDEALQIAFVVCFSSFVSGIVSLFGIGRHETKVILWKAAVGILASCIFGFMIFIVLFLEIGRQ